MNLVEPLICIAGKNDIAVRILLHLIEDGFSNRLVVCPSKSDIGRSNWQPSLVRFANEFNISIVGVDQLKEIENLVFISLEFDQLICPRSFKSNCLYNLHFSSLPAYKGMYTSAHPILNGEDFTGVTLHKIDSGIDTGEIIDCVRFPIGMEDTARDLYFRYMEHAFHLLTSWLDKLCTGGRVLSYKQPAIGSSYYSKSSIRYSDIRIDCNKTAFEIVRQLRAYNFREFQQPILGGVKIGAWEISERRSTSKPGVINETDRGSLLVSSVDYDLEVWADTSLSWFEISTNQPNCLPPSQYINVRDENGWTPLIRAAYEGNASLCSLLLENGADPNLGNLNGTTPLMYAHSSSDKSRREKTSAVLIKAGANIEKRDRFKRSLSDYIDI